MTREGLSSVDTGPWRVDLWGAGKFWYIEHEITGKRKRIGPVRTKGTNYFDEAHAECARRNKKAD